MMKDDIGSERERHESYGMLGFSRTSGGPRNLFGTSIQHRDTIRLSLKEGSVCRGLNQDWFYGGKELFSVEMSYSQFAELITAMNVGDGIPVTIRSEHGKQMENPPYVDKAAQHLNEYQELISETYQDTQELIKRVSELFTSKKALNKQEREDILRDLSKISQNIGSSQSFQVSQFQEQMERTVTEAKGEIEAFAQNKLLQVGQQKLVEEMPVLLDAGDSISNMRVENAEITQE